MRPSTRSLVLAASVLAGSLCAPAPAAAPALPAVPLIGAPCEGCEAAFDGIPAEIPTRLSLRPEGAGGVPLAVSGRVLDAAGRPRAGVILYVHQTDASGRYPPADAPGLGAAARRHGSLRGWVQSGADGEYAIDTVRPGSYPRSSIPEHIHMQVIEAGCFTYFIDDLMFRDDPKLTPALERQLAPGRGGKGVVAPQRDAAGWRARRDIVLGLGIPGHHECAAARP